MPEHLIIRNVENVLNDKASENDTDADAYFRERINWTLAQLREYAIALKQVRDSGVTQTDKFGNGM